MPDVLAIVDLDGTLVDRDGGFARWNEEFCRDRDLGPATRAWIAELDERFRRDRQGFFVELVDELGLRERPSALWLEYRSVMPRLATAFPGVSEGLRTLRAAGWVLAVLSNGQRDNQQGKLEAAGLLEHFVVCRFSGESGLRKPDRAAFDDVLDAAGTEASSSVWMVGDDPELDVVGARQVGLSTMWISHGQDWPSGLAEPTRSAAKPAQALQALAVLEPA